MKSASSGWSFLRDSPELRGTLRYQLDTSKKSLVDIGEALEVKPDRLSKYFRGVKPSLTNWQVMKLANYLGVEVQLRIQMI